MKKLNAKQLREKRPTEEEFKKIKRNPIYIIVDNVLDTYNVGAIFRLADAVAAKKVYLCGETETPPNPKIKKASVSTWRWVDWEYATTAISAIKQLTISNSQLTIVAIEQHKKSIPLSKFTPIFPVAVVVGHETDGVSKEALEQADEIVELPMYGVNKSLNVMVSCGIVLYKVVEYLKAG